MDKIVIVGSGASGVHFALSVLKKGYEVTMLDVGYQREEILNPEQNINELRADLNDPVAYFLGENFEAFIPPDNKSEYYGIPPSKNYVLSKPPGFGYESSGFAPLFSFARGGLAEVWTGGSYPLNREELADFPFTFDEFISYYDEISDRIGISGKRDDLESFYPFHDNIMEPLDLDNHSDMLLSGYYRKKTYFNGELNFYMGRSRIATLTADKGSRKACTYTGRCLWGCPTGALYTPSITLDECGTFPNFKYVPDMFVTHFKYNEQGRVAGVVAENTRNGQHQEFDLDRLVLAAGTMSSSKIFMESIFRKTGEIVKLKGLMDNRQVMIPFLNLKMAGKHADSHFYQYHQLAIGIKSENPKDYVHGQITTLKSALIHPLIQSLPFDLKTSIYVFRNFHRALGLINLNFNDYRRDDNYVSLKCDDRKPMSTILINYKPRDGETTLIKKSIKTIRKAFLRLGCIITSGMIHIRPMGASVHYSGTIPMSENGSSFTTTKYCQSRDFNNLYFVDGTTFPFLPSKNLTLTLMANAIRVADRAF
jgi:choline dehydrogenase-like flavoprotein